jgi:hypothetical protein
METTIYWKSNFSHQNTSVNYVPQYNCDDSWISVPCPRPQWHKNSDEMSCVVLTCATTKIDEYCELRVEAHGNSSGNFVTPSALHDSTTESMSVCLFVCWGAIELFIELNIAISTNSFSRRLLLISLFSNQFKNFFKVA